MSERSALRRAAFLAGGCAAVLVWLSVLPQAPGQPMIVALAMAGVSAVVTRRLLVGDGESSEQTTHRTPTGGAPVIGWIDEDREGVLAA